MGIQALFVIAEKNFRDEEVLEPKAALERNGHKVTIASRKKGTARGMLGAAVEVPITLDDVKGDDFDMVVFCGGAGIDQLRLYEDPNCIRIAREAALAGRIVGSICLATKVLANAGLVENKKVTGWTSAKDYVVGKGGKWQDADVVVDGNIVTGMGPPAAKKFGEALVAKVRHVE